MNDTQRLQALIDNKWILVFEEFSWIVLEQETNLAAGTYSTCPRTAIDYAIGTLTYNTLPL